MLASLTHGLLSAATDIEGVPLEKVLTEGVDRDAAVLDRLQMTQALVVVCCNSRTPYLAINLDLDVEPNGCPQAFFLHPGYSITTKHAHHKRVMGWILLHVDGVPV